MAQFTTRVELHRANDADYEKLHAAMVKEGFKRTITSDDRVVYKLPTAEYDKEGAFSADDVYKSASRAATSTGKDFWLLVTEATRRLWKLDRA